MTSPSSSQSTSPEPAASAPAIPGPASSTPHVLDNSRRARVEEIFDDDDSTDDERKDAHSNPKCEYDHYYLVLTKTDAKLAKKKCKNAIPEESEAVDIDGIPIDVDVQSIADSGLTREGKTADIDEFYGATFDHS